MRVPTPAVRADEPGVTAAPHRRGPSPPSQDPDMTSTARMVALLALAAFASMAAMRISDPLLPLFAQQFDTTTGQAAHAISAYAVAYGVFQFFFGPLADRLGKLRVIAWALLASALANLGVVASGSLDGIIFWRALSGAAAAGIIPLAIAWIGETVPYGDRQATLARLMVGTLGGVIGGQLIGGLCADLANWRPAFAGLAGLYLTAWLMLRRVLTPGAAAAPAPAAPHTGMGPAIAGVIRVPWARVVLLAVALEGVAMYGALAFVPSYLHERLQIPLTAAGGILAAFGLGGLAYATAARRWVGWLGERGLSAVGGVLLGTAFAALAFVNHWLPAVLATFGAGLGMYMLHNTLQTHATQMAPQSRGTAVSLFACALFLGQSAGVAAAALAADSVGVRGVFAAAAIALPLIGLGFAQALRGHALPKQ